jgi:DNA-directed RNA polymerase specialized sigma subunit
MSTTVSGKKRSDVDPIVRELDDLKRLLIMFLLKAGTTQTEIAKVLDMDQGNLSRLIKVRDFKPFAQTDDK